MILITFIPWFLFWLILALHKAEPAALAGCAAAIAVIIVNFARGKSIKLLQVVTLLFFIVLSALALICDLESFSIWVRVSNVLLLALVTLLSILSGKPFTLQYAREQTAKDRWHDPEFIRINYAISWVWFFAFILCLIVPIAKLFGFQPPKAFGPIFSISIVLAAIKFSLWYARRGNIFIC